MFMALLLVTLLQYAGADELCANSMPPSPLPAPATHMCNSYHVCTGDVLGCKCPDDWGYPHTLHTQCTPQQWYPFKRRGTCMCRHQPTPTDRASIRYMPYPTPEWAVECPPCNTNYAGQLSPDDPQASPAPSASALPVSPRWSLIELSLSESEPH